MIVFPAAGRERVVAGAVLAGALVFVGSAVPRVTSAGPAGALTLPAVVLGADLVLAAALVTGWYPIRPVAQALAVFGLLVHVLVALRGGPVWTKGLSGLLAVAHGWALVLLFLLTAQEQDAEEQHAAAPDDDPGSGLAGADAPTPDDGGSGAPAPGPVETPVTDLVEVPASGERAAEREEHA